MSNIYIKWVEGNQAWCVMGGNLPRGAAWAMHDQQHHAERDARELADDLGVEYVGVRS